MKKREKDNEDNIEINVSAKNIWLEREKRLLESLDRKIEIISGLQDLVNSIELSESHEDIASKLNFYLIEVRSKFSKTNLDLAEEYKLLEKKETNRENELQDIFLRVNEILKNNEVFFLIEIERIITDLIDKNKYIQYNKNNMEFIIKDGMENGYQRNIKENITNVQLKPFSIIYTVSNSAFDLDYPNFVAFHKKNSPFIFIREGFQEPELTMIINHEEVHNILDSTNVKSSITLSFNIFKYNFEESEKELQNQNLQENNKQKVRQRILNITSSKILNSMHEEIVASLENIHCQGFSQYDRSTNEMVSMAVYQEKQLKLEGIINIFQTAGNELKEFLDFLGEKSQNCQDNQLKSFCKILKENLENSFLRMVEQMKEIEFIVKNLNEENQLKKEILYTLLRPTQYRHIRRYFEFKYGKERINEILEKKTKIITF